MAYGTETHTGYVTYECEIAHSSGIRVSLTADPFIPDSPTVDEATRDAIFQILLTTLAQIPGATIVSAVKRGKFATPVTP